ncbi:hypothetical protein BFP97_06815 [Roseivirga sp. 4D4]|uniref:hypothetical protein n=1 Tax=Roseivirga sp. 4D4 TaxID=1889784 RepID=UPI0008536D19|nr:hypothetical protein [Roseivirga sp. 4D4]OEK01238.1 hypothetical protein BFP97_06815 [Roseivirga sp. 4D4]
MDRERFNTLLSDPSLVTNADIKALNDYRKKYPYFQSLYVVVAKALKERDHPKTEAFIKKTAAYSTNPDYLQQIIDGDFKFPEKEDNPGTPSEKKPVSEETVAEIKATKDRIEALLASTESTAEVDSTKKSKPTASQVEIIEKFIKDQPSIERQKISQSELPSHQEDLASKALKGVEAFETETLAQLMMMQGKHKKAINIYKKLSLKFPEKSTYFAGRIEEVKSKKNV